MHHILGRVYYNNKPKNVKKDAIIPLSIPQPIVKKKSITKQH
jgi:hypothetical protein